jgi:hypothetical protein
MELARFLFGSRDINGGISYLTGGALMEVSFFLSSSSAFLLSYKRI